MDADFAPFIALAVAVIFAGAVAYGRRLAPCAVRPRIDGQAR